MSTFRSDLFRNPTPVQVQSAPVGRLARRASVLGILVFIPLAPLCGLVVALRALGTAGEPQGRAAIACLIALVMTAAQGFLGYRGWQYVEQIRTGPQHALVHGGLSELQPFRDELQSRYGAIREVALRDDGLAPYISMPQEARHYIIRCERGEMHAEVEFTLNLSLDEHLLQTDITRITLPDSKRGDLTYPQTPSAASASADPG